MNRYNQLWPTCSRSLTSLFPDNVLLITWLTLYRVLTMRGSPAMPLGQIEYSRRRWRDAERNSGHCHCFIFLAFPITDEMNHQVPVEGKTRAFQAWNELLKDHFSPFYIHFLLPLPYFSLTCVLRPFVPLKNVESMSLKQFGITKEQLKYSLRQQIQGNLSKLWRRLDCQQNERQLLLLRQAA